MLATRIGLRVSRSCTAARRVALGAFEALAWAGCLHDRLKADAPPLLSGLLHMRNVVFHQGVDVLGWIYTEPEAAHR